MKSLIVAMSLFAAACGSVGASDSAADDPKITSISPDHGPVAGGVAITLTGEGFGTEPPVVLVGGVLAPEASASDTTLTFTLPPGTEGAIADVTVGTQAGFATLAAGFTYNLRPVILSVSPVSGRGQGGTMITLKGRGFQAFEAGVPNIRIGGGLATNVQIIDDQTLTAVTGAVVTSKPFEKTDVEVENANGTAVLARAFTTTARGLIGLQRPSRVSFVDRLTGEITFLTNVGHEVRSCATKDGIMYGVGRSAVDGQHELFSFDPVTGGVTVIGPVGTAANRFGISSLTFVGDRLIGLNGSQGGGSQVTNRLVEINRSTGAVSVLGAAAIPFSRPAAIAPRDATSVYLSDNTQESIDTVAVASSGVVATKPLVGGSPSRVHGLVNLDGTLHLLERDANRLFTVNPTTGAMTLITNLTTSLQGLCETPSTF